MVQYKTIQKNESVVVIEACGEKIQLSSSVDIDNYLNNRFGAIEKAQPEVVVNTIDDETVSTLDTADDTPYRSKKKQSK